MSAKHEVETSTDEFEPSSFKLKVGDPRALDVEEVERGVARFSDLGFDPHTYKESGSGKPMPIKWVISKDGIAGASAIRDEHGLHMSLVEAYEGITPPLHFHEYREIFVPIHGTFGIFCGEEEHLVEIGPMDTFSVPTGILRRPELLKGDSDGKGLLMVIFDTPDDPHESEYVSRKQRDADIARGLGHLYAE